MDYLGCIEQRAVDIISEYLRVVSANNANNTSNKMNILPRSPTPGPSSPMNWRGGRGAGSGGPFVDLTELSDDEFLNEPAEMAEKMPPNSAGGLGFTAGTGGGGMGGMGMTFGNTANNISSTALNMMESDNKPVDLNTYKNKLSRKLGLKESASGSALFRTQPRDEKKSSGHK